MSEPAEVYSERRKEQLRENIRKANQARKEIAVMREEIQNGKCDPYVLIEGDHDRHEGRATKMEIRRLLPMIPGIGDSRTLEILVAMQLPLSRKLGDLSYQRRRELANLVRDARGVNV